MKRKFNKLLYALLTVPLCTSAIPVDTSLGAASGANIVFTDPESVNIHELGSERTTLFNEGWKFSLGKNDSAKEKEFNDASWKSVDLPHDFSISQNFTVSGEAESGFLPGGVGWYRKKFTIPASCSGKTMLLSFDGAYKDTYVYVNGVLLGENHYGYNSFAFDISKNVVCDGKTENVIAVRVEHTLPSSRWYSGSGIYRDVNLIITDPVHVDLNGTEVTTPDISENNTGTVKINVDVVNDGDSSSSVTVRNQVYASDGTAVSDVSEQTITVDSKSVVKTKASVTVESPKLWSLDDPNMYYVRTELLVSNSIVDTYDSDFGFRWFGFDNEGFSLNGKKVKLNGVCMHHDQGALGSAAYYDAIYRQLSIMKEMGVNAIRITHNPASKQYLEICSKLGLLAIEELFDGWNIAKNGNSQDFSVYFSKNLSADNQIYGGGSSMTWANFVVKQITRRDRNNPSLILWSLCNEVSEGAGDVGGSDFPTIAEELIRQIKAEDSVRQATLGDNKLKGNNYPNIIGVVNAVINSGGIAGFNYANRSQLATLNNTYKGSNDCIIASETSSAVNSRGRYMGQTNSAQVDNKLHLTSYDTSAVTWGKTAYDSMWDTLTLDYVAGEFVWTGFDYIGEPTPWNGTGTGSMSHQGAIPNSSYFGIVDTAGFPKDTYYLYRSQWKQDSSTTLHLVTAWDSTNMMYEGSQTPVWVYSNAPTVKLYSNGTLIGTATRKENKTTAGFKYYTYTTQSNNESLCTAKSGSDGSSLYAVFNVTYAKGTIRAEAFNENGEKIPENQIVGSYSVSTPDEVTKLTATSDKNTITADGRSLSYITVDVTDNSGNLSTTADNEITFSLEGNGEIVGVDNGDQATLDKYQQASVLTDSASAKIKAYAGKALVIVKSTKESGSFTLTASASGLTPSTVTVNTVRKDGSSKKEIVSYQMSKHFYAPEGVLADDISLPNTTTISYSDGSSGQADITWKDYDTEQLKTVGTFNINGSFTASGQTVPLFITAHIYGNILSADNYAGITRPNVIPSLPSTSMTYCDDGASYEAFPVAWDLSEIKEDDFATSGTIQTISGTVKTPARSLPVKATIRVAEPTVVGTQNVASAASHLTEDQRYNDSLSAVNDGKKYDEGHSSDRWSTYDKMDEKKAGEAVLTMCWDTAITTNEIDMYYFYQPSTEKASALPSSVKFEYALSCSYEASTDTITSNRWTEIPYSAPTEFSVTGGEYNWTVGRKYSLTDSINPVALRITLGYDAGTFIGLNEMEIISPSIVYNSNSEAELQNISVDGKPLDGFTGSRTDYTLQAASFGEITYENEYNAAVTMIPVGSDRRELRVISEDGSASKTYSIALTQKPEDPDAAMRQLLASKLKEAQSLDSSLYTPESYAKLAELMEQVEAGIETADKALLEKYLSDLATAEENLVKKGEAPTPPETEETEPPETEPPQTEPPETEPPQTEPPETEPPETEPPETEPPETEPPQTEPPQTEPPETEQPPYLHPTLPQTEAPQNVDRSVTAPTLKNGDTVTYKSVVYQVIDAEKGTAAAVKCIGKKQKKISIPATVSIKNTNCPVVQISAGAFKGCKKLTTVTIGKNVSLIGKNAFRNCKKLRKVFFKGTSIKTIKTGAFKKTGRKMTVKVPKKLKKKQRSALKKKLIKSGMPKKFK